MMASSVVYCVRMPAATRPRPQKAPGRRPWAAAALLLATLLACAPATSPSPGGDGTAAAGSPSVSLVLGGFSASAAEIEATASWVRSHLTHHSWHRSRATKDERHCGGLATSTLPSSGVRSVLLVYDQSCDRCDRLLVVTHSTNHTAYT